MDKLPLAHRWRSAAALAGLVLWAVLPTALWAQSAERAAFDSITADELGEHVAVLADDVYEGRLAGSRGGHAAGQYLVQQLREYNLKPAGTDGGYFQPFDDGDRNILVLWPGSDPLLRDEVIVVGAHYDHVGTGTRGHVFGPKGPIYNGADDNASGVSVLLEVIEALATTPLETRRSILFAFWDGEEMGLLGSQYWLNEPTVPLERVPLAVNLDMVGRLRDQRLLLLASRTGYGLRQICSGLAEEPLWLDFSWQLEANGDHWNFLEHKIPVAMLHTGLHDDYHRPTDDVEKINRAGHAGSGPLLVGAVGQGGRRRSIARIPRGGHARNTGPTATARAAAAAGLARALARESAAAAAGHLMARGRGRAGHGVCHARRWRHAGRRGWTGRARSHLGPERPLVRQRRRVPRAGF